MFDKCIDVILKNEGGYVNHPNDPGGETNFGITKRNYPMLDIKNLTRERAKQLYYRDYWLGLNLYGIKNEELVLQIFDFAVNAGQSVAVKRIQRIVKVEADGLIGPITRGKINDFSGDIIELYKEARRNYYKALVRQNKSYGVFLQGWLNRVDKTKF
jgi:lysozyme family protein